jgi:circadian clock protein KaiC
MSNSRRKSTGIPKFDDLIEGGFKEGTIDMIEGDAGSGKSTFAVQYLLSGIAAGERGIYLSIEEDKASFFENMERFGFRLEDHERSGNLLFYECTATKLKDFLDKGSLGIEEQIKMMDAKRIVLDSISAFALAYDSDVKQRNSIQKLFEKMKSWNLTTLLIAETMSDNARLGLPYLVDGWVKLYYKKVAYERVRTIEVLKMRGTRHRATETVYRIEDHGINLYPDERMFESQN